MIPGVLRNISIVIGYKLISEGAKGIYLPPSNLVPPLETLDLATKSLTPPPYNFASPLTYRSSCYCNCF